ncbi:hypothetical protein HN388_00250 [bacterium]|jgi:hypothetical protein|nr:hypothetical protein [bacterium]
MNRVITAVVLAVLLLTSSLAWACLDVDITVPFHHSHNPVEVINGDPWLVEQACEIWENTINQNYYPQEWYLYVADGTAPNTVSYGPASPAHCIPHFSSDLSRMLSFEIEFYSGGNWCEQSDPSGCEIQTWSFLDVMTHELGHGVGVGHCSNIMDCETFTSMNAADQQLAYPTMVGADEHGGPDNCNYLNYGCGYISPFVVMHTLSDSDITAAHSLYDGYVVQTLRTVNRVVRTGNTLQIDFFLGWDPGRTVQVMGSAASTGPEFTLSAGPVPVIANAESRQVVFQLEDLAGELNYLWIRAHDLEDWLGPFLVEESAVAIVLRSPVMGDATPNPFNPVTTITFEIRTPGSYQGKIYDMLGQ